MIVIHLRASDGSDVWINIDRINFIVRQFSEIVGESTYFVSVGTSAVKLNEENFQALLEAMRKA